MLDAMKQLTPVPALIHAATVVIAVNDASHRFICIILKLILKFIISINEDHWGCDHCFAGSYCGDNTGT